MVPHVAAAPNASAAFKIFDPHAKKTSSTVSAKLGRDGLSFGTFNALRGRAFFTDRQREVQLLPDITRRGCGSVLFGADASAIGCSDYCLRNFPLVVGSRVAI
jgi:hypothetical protein